MKTLKVISAMFFLLFTLSNSAWTVGTCTAGAPLCVAGNQYAMQFNLDTDIGIYFNLTNSRFEFRGTNQVPLFFVGVASEQGYFRGDLGIGTATPTSKLDVIGKTRTTDLQVTNGAQAGYLLSSVDANGNAQWSSASSLGLGPDNDWTISSTAVYNNTSKNIGIGTSSPAGRLGIITASATSNPAPAIHIKKLAAAPAGHLFGDYMQVKDALGNSIFQINTSGNVGIRKSSPSARLDIDVSTSSTTQPIYPGLRITQPDLSTVPSNQQVGEYFVVESTNGTIFEIDVDGNFGVGTDASASVRLNVDGGAKFSDPVNSSNFFIQSGSSLPHIAQNNFGSSLKLAGFALGGGSIQLDADVHVVNKLRIGTENLTTGPHANPTLSVDGKSVMKECVVTVQNWADFVFEDDYDLMDLKDVELYINEHNHLPNIPSEEVVLSEGISLGEMDALLLQKIEELTLYMIELKKENEQLKTNR